MITSLLLLALKSLLVAAITLGLLRLNARRSAAERSTIAHLGLFALIALPLASLALPKLTVALPEPAPEALPPVVTSVTTSIAAAPAFTAAPVPAAPDWTSILIGQAEALAPYAWLLPAIALLALTGIALLRLVSLRTRAQVLVEPIWLGALARAQRRMGFKNGTALLVSDDLSSPISWGLMRPTILLNQEALDAGEQAEAIIAHELAHVIQRDWAKLMLARIATAAFWFNPLAWVLAREAHQLREEAADDAVLAADISGLDYAELLVGVARHESRTFMLTAHGVAPSRNSLRRRIARVLDSGRARGASGRSWVAGFTAGMLVMAAPLAAVTLGQAQAEPQVLAASPAKARSLHTTALAAIVSPNRHADIQVAPATTVPASPLPVPAPSGAPAASAALATLPAPAPRPAPAAPAAPAAQPAPAASPAPAGFSIQLPNFNYYIARYAVPAVATAVRTQIQAAQVQVQVEQAGYAARAAAQSDQAHRGDTVDVDQLIQMRAVGVTPEFQHQMAAAGFPNLSVNELVQARSIGLDADYIREMRQLGVNGGFPMFVQARAVGLSTDYVRGMKAAGVTATVSQYQQMAAVGVSPGYVRSLHAHGLNVTAPSKLIQLKSVGYDPDDRNGDDHSP
jgi:beta-lactamase regulating signal transducer with metallopeptidase domain